MPVAMEPPVTPVTQQCMQVVSQNLGIPLAVLYAVLYTEAGAPGRVSHNTNGTKDLGPMQVNDRVWGPFFRKNYGITESQLKNNGCLNVWAGGVILYMQVSQAKDWWKGIGNYHSRTPVHHDRYKYTVAKRLQSWGVFNAQPASVATQLTQRMEQAQPAGDQAIESNTVQQATPHYRRY